MGVTFEVHPGRLKALRTRLGLPLHAGAEKVKASEEELASWESQPTEFTVKTLQQIAKAYNYNWYVFLLEDDAGPPAVPHDFRRRKGGASELGFESLLAIDNAWRLLDRIESLGPAEPSIVSAIRATLGDDPEEISKEFRKLFGVSGLLDTPDNYAVLRFWTQTLTGGGVYVAQVPLPIKEARAFCLSRAGRHLVVLSNKDYPTARAFSLIHEIGHLLLGSDAICRPTPAGFGRDRSAEPWCNRFAGAVLMPRSLLESSPRFHELMDQDIVLGSAKALAKEFGVSEVALLRRLETFGHISTAEYQRLEREADEKWKDDDKTPSGGGFLRHKDKVIARQSPLFVRQVFDAYGNGDISYREIGTYLDVPLRSIAGIREAVG